MCQEYGFFGRTFLKGFFQRNSLGGILTLLKSAKLFEYGRNWFVCQDFVSMEKEGQKFQSLEVREQAPSHLKITPKIRLYVFFDIVPNCNEKFLRCYRRSNRQQFVYLKLIRKYDWQHRFCSKEKNVFSHFSTLIQL